MSPLFTLLCFELVFFVTCDSKSPITTLKTSSSLALKLIHTDLAPNSHDNSNITLSEQIRRADYSSMARYNYLTTKNIQPSEHDDIHSRLTPDKLGLLFFTNFSIGEPPVSVTAVIDTGSDLLWVPCQPCKNCSSQSNPPYDPAKSSTYANVSCDSQYCDGIASCSTTRHCDYNAEYGDKAYSRGELAMEQFKFTTSDDGLTSKSGIVFGCGHDNDLHGHEGGILGLGAERISLVSQLGSKFSYCIGSVFDPNYEYNHLIIGEEAIIQGFVTPLNTDHGLYYLTLEGISLGNKRLKIDPGLFIKKSFWDTNGVIIDTGSTLSYLAKSAYNSLAEELESLFSGMLEKAPDENHRLCYNGIAGRDTKGIPVLTFHLSGEAVLVVGEEGLFMQYSSDVFCLTIAAVDDDKLNVIGMTAQQNYNFGYNLKEKTLSFQTADCSLLEE